MRRVVVAWGVAAALAAWPVVAAADETPVQMHVGAGTAGVTDGIPVDLRYSTDVTRYVSFWPIIDGEARGDFVMQQPTVVGPYAFTWDLATDRSYQWELRDNDGFHLLSTSDIVAARSVGEQQGSREGRWRRVTSVSATDGHYREATSSASIRFRVSGQDVAVIVDASVPFEARVWIDGKRLRRLVYSEGGSDDARYVWPLKRWSKNGQHRVRIDWVSGRLRVDGLAWTQTLSTHLAWHGCSWGYPSLCVPDPPPTLTCGEVGEADFYLWPYGGLDPHGFDADHDGVACES